MSIFRWKFFLQVGCDIAASPWINDYLKFQNVTDYYLNILWHDFNTLWKIINTWTNWEIECQAFFYPDGLACANFQIGTCSFKPV